MIESLTKSSLSRAREFYFCALPFAKTNSLILPPCMPCCRLVLNEIGGVINGSLKAAQNKRPLNEAEYLAEIRSNIPNGDDAGIGKRKLVFREFVEYGRWKKDNSKYDLGDIVLELIQLGGSLKCQEFVSAYLDEVSLTFQTTFVACLGAVTQLRLFFRSQVQDFTYATIFLICSVAGKIHSHWVAAGDTAQMISPGCSFKFAGLQQTLRAVGGPGVSLNNKVEKLRRNYRMTKSVLDLGNAILLSLKKEFPDQIEYAKPEVPMKDLGLR